jgi:putative aldouronate transport system permease protein
MNLSIAGRGQRRRESHATPTPGAAKPRTWRGTTTLRQIRRHWQLYVLAALPLAFLIVFNYIPILGAQIAFRDYNPVDGMWGSRWIGLEQFRIWANNPMFWPVIRNTLVVSVYVIVVGTPCTIILALALNEVRHRRFKKFVQTTTYLPFFISTIVMVGMMHLVLNPSSGLLQRVASAVGIHEIPDVFGSADAFSSLYVWSGVWQETGYGAIIYLGVLASVDTDLYDAARIDGASILQKIRYVDLPAIMPTMVILLILSMGSILAVGFEKVYLLQNPLNLESSQVISTYVYQVGLAQDNFSFGAAVGLFNSVVSLILILVVNFIARRVSNVSLF